MLLIVLGGIAAGLALLMRGGISARMEPSHIEAAIARKLRRIGIPNQDRQLPNPVPASKEVLAAARAHFADHCAICHANDGSGQTEMGRNLYPRSPDLRQSATQQLTDGEMFYIVENGVRLTGMPGWGDGSEDSKRASWHLVHFIRHLPELTRDEKLEMERLNPKSPEEWREMHEDEEFLQGKEPSTHESTHHH
ncbi:MAG: cytochrome c [Myxococcales bacterium]|nr:c-type cytochrome [Myxococcales bacterium]